MEANARALERLFDAQISYQVPLFQRPYVWNVEDHWEPLWDDIQKLLDDQLAGVKARPHFLGAVVLEVVQNSTGGIQERQVIDGQQRMTTLQLFLIAARDVAATSGVEKMVNRFSDVVSNRADRIDSEDEAYKIWPTNADRDAFKIVHAAGSPAALKGQLDAADATLARDKSIVGAYLYFYEKIRAWISGELDEEDAPARTKSKDDRLGVLWNVMMNLLKVVVIDLEKEDEAQVIFETLNARGQELLPADLIKNFLFRRCASEGEPVEKLYEQYWKAFESDFWREEVKQGRIKRPRVDTFINYFLVMETRGEVKSTHLFNDFKIYVQDLTDLKTADVIRRLARFGKVFAQFEQPKDHPRLVRFLRRMKAIDTTTFFPFLLRAYDVLVPGQRDEFDRLLGIVESFLARRQIINLTTKGYNRLFIDLIVQATVDDGFDVDRVETFLSSGKGDSSRLPSDAELRSILIEDRLYNRLAQYKVRFVLEALDAYAFNPKSEIDTTPEDLTIEHVMPQDWAAHWPMASFEAEGLTPEAISMRKSQATTARDRIVHTLGNLTLITDRLNPSLSNGSWTAKRPELLKFSKLNLTQYFHKAECASWDENAIRARSEVLADQILKIWPDFSSARDAK